MNTSLDSYLKDISERINQFLSKNIKSSSERLTEAMLYSSEGGKRLRGCLCAMSFEAICERTDEKEKNRIIPICAAIECVHAMSLVHDDMPCMDNDDLRRGKPSCHKKFDEATALLTGDALLIESFKFCTQAEFEAEILLKVLAELSEASGCRGMTGGQSLDMEFTGKEKISLEELKRMQRLKTGKLINASVRIGAICSQASSSQLESLTEYSEKIGLAFQIIDDLLDLEGDSITLGKTAGKDLIQRKNTFPSLIGVPESKEVAKDLIKEAKEALQKGNIQFKYMYDLADFFISREF